MYDSCFGVIGWFPLYLMGMVLLGGCVVCVYVRLSRRSGLGVQWCGPDAPNCRRV